MTTINSTVIITDLIYPFSSTVTYKPACI